MKMKIITKILGILLAVALLTTVFAGAGAATFTQTYSSLTPSGSLVPGQAVTAEVTFTINASNLQAGDVLSVDPIFDAPWEVTVTIKGNGHADTYTLTDSAHYSYINGISLINYGTSATVDVTSTGLVPNSAAGKNVAILSASIEALSGSTGTSEVGTAKTNSVYVYNLNDLASDKARISNGITTLTQRIANYNNLIVNGVSIGSRNLFETAETAIATAQEDYNRAEASGASTVLIAKSVIDGVEQIAKAESSVNSSALQIARLQLEETNELISTLQEKNRDVTNYQTLYAVYSDKLTRYSSSATVEEIDQLITDLQTLNTELNERLQSFSVTYPETLQLREGWNFISIPMKLDSSMDTASEFFSEVDMDNKSIFGYDGSTGKWVQLSASTVLNPLDGYWVYSKTDFTGTKTIVFDTKSMTLGNTKDIYKGWNAVGLNIDVTDGTNFLSAKSTFAGLDWNRYFENYTSGTWKVIVNGGSAANNEENYIYAGVGGWLYANEDGILVGNAS